MPGGRRTGIEWLIYSGTGLRSMDERETRDLAVRNGADISIVPGNYHEVYSAYKDELDCFLRAYVLLRNVPGINETRDEAGENFGRYFFPTSERNVLSVMNAIQKRIRPGASFTYRNLRDMVSDAPFCEVSVNPMRYRSAKENEYGVSRKETGLDIPLEADNKILAVKGINLSRIEELFAEENEPTGQIPKPGLVTVADFFTFLLGSRRLERLYDLGQNLRFDLLWLTPTYAEVESFCTSTAAPVKSRDASLRFSSTFQDSLSNNASLVRYLSDLSSENFPVYPVDQLLLNTGENKDSTRRGYLVHRSIGDAIRAAIDLDISEIIWGSQEFSRIRRQVDELSEKLRFIEDIRSTVLTSSIHGDQYTCNDLIEELMSNGVITRTRLGGMRLNEKHPDKSYLDTKRSAIISRMEELFRSFLELPLSDISGTRYISGEPGPSDLLLE